MIPFRAVHPTDDCTIQRLYAVPGFRKFIADTDPTDTPQPPQETT